MVFNKHEETRIKRVRNILVAITGSNDTLIDYIINHTYYTLVLLEKGGRGGGDYTSNFLRILLILQDIEQRYP